MDKHVLNHIFRISLAAQTISGELNQFVLGESDQTVELLGRLWPAFDLNCRSGHHFELTASEPKTFRNTEKI
jgi:hypothetical protein